MIYTIEEIRERVIPIAKKYNLKSVYLFGSYARGEATEESDVDLLVDDGDVKDIGMLVRMYEDFENLFENGVDIFPMENFLYPAPTTGPYGQQFQDELIDGISRDRRLLYER